MTYCESVGFFEKSPKVKSMMRLLAAVGTGVGSVVILWAMVLLTMLVRAVTKGVPDAASSIGSIALVVGGALGLILGGQGFKALQQRGETKENGNG